MVHNFVKKFVFGLVMMPVFLHPKTNSWLKDGFNVAGQLVFIVTCSQKQIPAMVPRIHLEWTGLHSC
jgi:hypothetical protein